MRCSKCNEEPINLTTVVIDNKTYALCDKCLIRLHGDFPDIDELDKTIGVTQGLIKQAEGFVASTKDTSDIEATLPQGVFTPARHLLSTKNLLVELMKQKERLLDKMTEKERLLYKLKCAKRDENYELAAEIRDKLEKME